MADGLQNATVPGAVAHDLPASGESLLGRHDHRCRGRFSTSISCVIVVAGVLVAGAYGQFGWRLRPAEN